MRSDDFAKSPRTLDPDEAAANSRRRRDPMRRPKTRASRLVLACLLVCGCSRSLPTGPGSTTTTLTGASGIAAARGRSSADTRVQEHALRLAAVRMDIVQLPPGT